MLIEATIAEVTLNDELRFGVQYYFQHHLGNNTFSLTNQVVLPPVTPVPGFAFVLGNSKTPKVILDLLSAITEVKVISSPHLAVTDNQSATLQVGDEIPVSIGQSTSVIGNNSPIVNQIQFRSTGVILRVTPRVNANGRVTLDVAQEVSNLANPGAGDSADADDLAAQDREQRRGAERRDDHPRRADLRYVEPQPVGHPAPVRYSGDRKSGQPVPFQAHPHRTDRVHYAPGAA